MHRFLYISSLLVLLLSNVCNADEIMGKIKVLYVSDSAFVLDNGMEFSMASELRDRFYETENTNLEDKLMGQYVMVTWHRGTGPKSRRVATEIKLVMEKNKQ